MSPETSYDHDLDDSAAIQVWFVTEQGVVVEFAVVLTAFDDDRLQTIRVYDNAHGVNELHRHSRSTGKRKAEVFHHGTPAEALNAAVREVRTGHAMMVEAWRRS